jgi:hypothetical protein
MGKRLTAIQTLERSGTIIDEWTADMNPNFGLASPHDRDQLVFGGKPRGEVFGHHVKQSFHCKNECPGITLSAS